MAPKRTSGRSWIDSLYHTLAQTSEPRLAVVGIGHELRGDDAAGIAIARKLQSSENERLRVINAGAAPENFTGVLREFVPDLVLIVDAMQMNEPPGTVQLFNVHDTENYGVTTHALSCHMFALYLEVELNCVVKLLGIQAGQDSLGAELSPEVRQSVASIARVLRGFCRKQRDGQLVAPRSVRTNPI
jgi:hydrogenase maturation protease HycI